METVFNNVLFSTEKHNPLHAHLLAQSHNIYIIINIQSKPIEVAGFGGIFLLILCVVGFFVLFWCVCVCVG